MKTLHFSPRFLLVLAILALSGFGLSPVPPVVTDSNGELDGAWKMVLNRGQSMSDLNLDMVKILADGHFMFAFYNRENQEFFSCGGGEYKLSDGRYTETIRFHTIDPELVGRSLTFDAAIDNGTWYQTGEINGGELNEVYERLDGESATAAMGAWKMQASGIEEDMKSVRRKDPQTWKLIAGDHYGWATFDPKTGELLSCGGGNIHLDNQSWVEEIAYNSADSLLVGKHVLYEGAPRDQVWEVKMPLLRGGEQGEVVQWQRMD